MKNLKKYLLSACALSALICSPVHADIGSNPDWYLGLSGDLTWLRHSDTGGGGNIALGRAFQTGSFGDFRLEAEAGYHETSGSHYYSYMGNAYYDFTGLAPSMPWKLTPYIGAGIGDLTAHLDESDSSGSYNVHGNVFAYQFMAGVNLNVDTIPNVDWSLGYRHVGSSDVDGTNNVGAGVSDRVISDSIELGARFHF